MSKQKPKTTIKRAKQQPMSLYQGTPKAERKRKTIVPVYGKQNLVTSCDQVVKD